MQEIDAREKGRYSVLMSVYKNEKAEFLKLAISSMFSQTVPTDDFVLVCDGPLTAELEDVISEYQSAYPACFQQVRLKENKGLGIALQRGVLECRNELIARMDSDDIAAPDRCEKQLKLFSSIPSLSLCSGTIAEFQTDPKATHAFRKLPCSQEDILRYAKKRNPMNHMAVMFRKSSVLDAGNYQPVPLAEDYDLWVRMLGNGCQAANLPDVLVYARTGNGMIQRRGGIQYIKSIYALQRRFLKYGFISHMEFIRNCLIRTIAGLMPGQLRGFLYQFFLR